MTTYQRLIKIPEPNLTARYRCVAAVEMALHLCHLSCNTTPNQLKFSQSICLHT